MIGLKYGITIMSDSKEGLTRDFLSSNRHVLSSQSSVVIKEKHLIHGDRKRRKKIVVATLQLPAITESLTTPQGIKPDQFN